MKEICIIGATSPLGINLISLLVENSYKVFASYRMEAGIPQEFRHHSDVTWLKTDLSQEKDWTKFCKDNVVWLAHLEQGRFNDQEIETNIKPFRSFLKQIKQSAAEKFVFISSGGAIYGEPQFLPITEAHRLNPLSSYGKTKKALEEIVYEFSRPENFKTAIIRPGNIYGFENPDRESKGIIAVFLKSIRNRTAFTLIHRGQTERDFVHVNDVSRAILCAIESPQPRIIWNVGTGKGHKIIDVLEMILKKSNFEKPIINHLENYSSDVNTNILSINRITSESDWSFQFNIEEGIQKTVDNWLKYEKNLSPKL